MRSLPHCCPEPFDYAISMQRRAADDSCSGERTLPESHLSYYRSLESEYRVCIAESPSAGIPLEIALVRSRFTSGEFRDVKKRTVSRPRR